MAAMIGLSFKLQERICNRILHLLDNGCTDSHPEVSLLRAVLTEHLNMLFQPTQTPVRVDGVASVETSINCMPPSNVQRRCPDYGGPCDLKTCDHIGPCTDPKAKAAADKLQSDLFWSWANRQEG